MEYRDTEVVVVGSTMMDLVTYAKELPKVGETVFGREFVTSFGGKGANQAVQCSRLGTHTALIGRIGMDKYGDEYLKQLKEEKIFKGLMKRPRNLGTGTATIQVDDSGQNTIIVVPGANNDFTEMDIICIEYMIENAKVVLCQNEIPIIATRKTLEFCQKHQTISVLNTAPASPGLKELIPLCDIVCSNEVELAYLTGLPTSSNQDVEVAASALISMGCRVVVVTLGARGAYLCCSQKKQFFVAPKVEAVDTVGAGDSFIGSFASYIARGTAMDAAIERAISCASISVQKRGSQISYPRLADLIEETRPPATPNNSKTELRMILQLD